MTNATTNSVTNATKPVETVGASPAPRKYLLRSLLSAVAQTWRAAHDRVLDAVDEATGAMEMRRMLQEENERLTRELCETQERLRQVTQSNARTGLIARRERASKAKMHLIAARYAHHDRCDHLARDLYTQKVATAHGKLASNSLN